MKRIFNLRFLIYVENWYSVYIFFRERIVSFEVLIFLLLLYIFFCNLKLSMFECISININ